MEKPKNHLFLIGIDNYIMLDKLNCCVKDCVGLKEILIDKYGFTKDSTLELFNEFATNLNIQQKFKEYIKLLNNSDNLIIYYSGHGGYDKTTEKGFWVPFDSNSIDFTTWIGNETILSYIRQIKAKHIFLISDSCFSRSILITEPIKAIFSNADDYDQSPSRWALTSGDKECKDGSPGEFSFFGESLIQILSENDNDISVSKIITLIKDRFQTNYFQKPQGYPLQDTKHRGGEFIFKATADENLDKKEVKGYKDFLTILKIYRRNSNFKEMGHYENKTLKIGFQLFQEYDEVLKKATYFLNLFQGINQQKTYDYIKERHPEIFREKALIILIPNEKKQVNPGKRRQNIFDKFQPLNIFYIDDFIRDQCTPKNLASRDGKYLDIPNFIVPNFTFNKQLIESPEFIKEWLDHDNEPILIIKGEGGIGKTTFAQFIADKFIKQNEKSSVLFIDSSEIRAELMKRKNIYDNINIYSFYEALYESSNEDNEKLNEDLFRLNLDAGNFLLIIDGLDEVISQAPDFNVDEFLNSIIGSTSDIGSGKIVIACRSYFWEASKFTAEQIKTIEILPFDEEKTNKFFEKSFPNDKKKIERALNIAEEFKFKDEDGKVHFHPYVLEVVRLMVESNQQILKNQASFSSKILEKTVKNDFIIYSICYRERLRVEQISIDEQVEFFSYWSLKRRGILSLENFNKELKEALGKHIDKNTIEAFKSHPFIQVEDRTVRFRYDFFADYFKCIFVSRHLILDSPYEKISDDFLKIISENCWYGSSMIKDIKNRIPSWTDNELLKVSDLINQILERENLEAILKRMCISGLFNICIALNIRFKSNSIYQNTLLIKSLFGIGVNEILGLHLINVHSSEELIRFDFCNLTLRECYIDNYQAFWLCSFDDNTFFIDSYLANIEFDINDRIPIPKHHFQNCTTDPQFISAYKKDEHNHQNISEQVRDFLQDFFRLFYSRGMLQNQTLNKPHKGREHHPPLNRRYAHFTDPLMRFDEIIEFLNKENILEFHEEFAEEKISISNPHKNDIIKFIKDGTISTSINSLIIKLCERFRK